MLQEAFIHAAQHYTADHDRVQMLWQEIEKKHSTKDRFYHNLTHLENLLTELQHVQPLLSDWDCCVFAIAYHDIVYSTTKKDNEEKSAELAQKNLAAISLPPDKISHCVELILATKSHRKSEDSDSNYFTDADLSVLGSDWDRYQTYAANVRKEYSFYPDLLYKPGRKKVLGHFLQMDRVFKTEEFYSRYENQARQNLEMERKAL